MNHVIDLDYRLWDMYLAECQKTKTQPDMSDFQVWCQDQDIDTDEVER